MTKQFSLPAVGDGATYNVGSDRYAATVVRVTPRTVVIQDDIMTAAPGSDYYGTQKYVYTPNPNGATRIARWSDKHGWRLDKYSHVSFGHRAAWQNPSF